MATARAAIHAFLAADADGPLDAIIVNASGCGTTVKDYGHMFANGPLAAEAAKVAGLARDVSEVMADLRLSGATHAPALRVAYHAACSLQHGQQIKATPKERELLKQIANRPAN